MEANGLVGVLAVIVVPIEQRARRLRRFRQRVHRDRPANVDLAGARHQIVAHHAHHGARHDAEILLHRRPALHGADLDLGLAHPVLDDEAELGHLD